VADLATTLYVLRKGTGAEGNPVARKLMDFFGPELGLALPKLALCWGYLDVPGHDTGMGLCSAVHAVPRDRRQQHEIRTEEMIWPTTRH
jgi:hypothetical protein